MVIDLIPRSIWKHKIEIRQRRLVNSHIDLDSSMVSLDDYLIASNQVAVDYFEHNQNPLKKLWEYHNLDPACSSHSTYTYAAFLSLTEGHDRTELQEDVRWVGGIYIHLENKKARGHHAWLEKKIDDEWKPFETIPHMRNMPVVYSPWYTFQLSRRKSKITSEQFMGLLAISIYYLFNS